MKLQWPVNPAPPVGAFIRQKFGENNRDYTPYKGHMGIDFTTLENEPSYFPSDGYLYEVVKSNTGYGNHVKYWYEEDGYQYLIVLGHYNSLNVPVGFYGFTKYHPIKRGQLVGKVGETGYSNEPHVHLGKYQYKNNILLNSDNGYGGALNPINDLLPESDFKTSMSNVKLIKNGAEFGFYIPCTTPDALISYGENFGKTIPKTPDGKVDFGKLALIVEGLLA